MIRQLLVASAVVLAACSNDANTIGGHPLPPNDVSYSEGICTNGLSCLVLTVSDRVGACSLQQTAHSTNALYGSSTFATFELYAADGVGVPIPEGNYPVSTTLGPAPASVVTFYTLDADCAGTFTAVARSGQVSLSGTQSISVTYSVDFGVGILSGTVSASPCVVDPDTATPICY